MSNLSKNYLYNVISLFTGMLFPFITFPYISRILMPEYLGKVTFAQSLTSYFIRLALLGIPVYGVRELSRAIVSEEKNDFSKIFTELLLISLISSVFSTILFYLLISFNSKVEEIKMLMYLYLFQVIFAFLTLDYIFIVLERHKRRTIRTVILRVISLALMLTLVKKPEDYLIYGAILIFPEIIARIIDFYFCRKYIYTKMKDLNFKRHFRSLLTLFIFSFSIGIYVSLDTTILGFMKNEEEVGLYSTGTKLVKMIIPIVSILGTVMAPQIIKHIKKKDNEQVYSMIDKFIDFCFLLGIPGIFLMTFLAKDIILLISGNTFINSTPTMKLTAIIIITIPLGTFFGSQILIPNDKEKLVLKVSVIGMTLNVILNLLLIPKYGIEGAAFALLATEFLICVYRGFEVKKIYPDYKFITQERINYITIGLISFGLLFIVRGLVNYNYMINILLFSTIYAFVYFSGLIILKDKNIRFAINKILKK